MANVAERPRRKRLSWESRCEIVARVRDQGLSVARAAECSGVHRSTVYRLLERFDRGGWGAQAPPHNCHPRSRCVRHLAAGLAVADLRRLAESQLSAVCGLL